MRESSIVVRPESPDSPNYTFAARLQAAGLQSAIDLFVDAANAVPVPEPPHPIVIADYGAASGHNALLPVSAAIRTLRGRTRQEHAILVAHTDIPDNDFTALFETLTEDPDSYLRKDAAVYCSAIGRSFYQQLLPSQSVSLGWSSWAIHWLSQTPQPIPDHILPALSSDERARAACERQAAQDWQNFVAYRGRELVGDGRLVVLTMGVDKDRAPGLLPLVESIYTGLKQMVGTGLITADELRAMSIPIVGRGEKDFAAPFAPKDRYEGLSIETVEISDAEDRYYQQFLVDQDANALGAKWGSFMRVSVFGCLVAALSGGSTDPRADEFSAQLERRVAAQIAAAPARMHIPLAKVVLRKHPRSRD
ncbi:SAM-dependent methyltransferase [[Mycobacterium] burgundiense]|uniref:SAM-dependent methyltransferase n=1 Tax=[Mycobacterium] burgundiense TaxID=3064286 RepID=A0ABM9LMU4_9MYCO|nr:SAM-dependent methyltransferase [Mycolicibacterium sp. MU0053]CAJ1501624.1 SAM-dependent methyltransferase [Mycolicibacterium sp. MU0053]